MSHQLRATKCHRNSRRKPRLRSRLRKPFDVMDELQAAQSVWWVGCCSQNALQYQHYRFWVSFQLCPWVDLCGWQSGLVIKLVDSRKLFWIYAQWQIAGLYEYDTRTALHSGVSGVQKKMCDLYKMLFFYKTIAYLWFIKIDFVFGSFLYYCSSVIWWCFRRKTRVLRIVMWLFFHLAEGC